MEAQHARARSRSRSPMSRVRDDGRKHGTTHRTDSISSQKDEKSIDYARSRAEVDNDMVSEVSGAPSSVVQPFHVVIMVRLLGPWMLHRVMELVDAGIDAHVVVDVELHDHATQELYKKHARNLAVPALMAKSRSLKLADSDGMTAEESEFCAKRVHYIRNSVIEAAGYLDLQTKTCGKNKTAWERGLYWCAGNTDWDYVFTIEDDAQWTDPAAIKQLCERYQSNDADLLCHSIAETVVAHPRWPHWSSGEGFFDKSVFTASFNVVMRMSQQMLQAVREFGAKHKTLLFHELMFASLAKQQGLKIHYWNDEPLLALRWRPEYTEESLRDEYFGTTKCIFHPIKRETKIWYELDWPSARAVAFAKKIYSKPKPAAAKIAAYDDI